MTTTEAVVEIAKAIAAAPGLKFTGIQAYQGAMQHLDNYEDRKAKLDAAIAQVKDAVEALKRRRPRAASSSPAAAPAATTSSRPRASTTSCSAAATPSWTPTTAASRTRTATASTTGEWENALFILTSVMSHAKPDLAVCDAGLKAQSVDSRPARSSTAATT